MKPHVYSLHHRQSIALSVSLVSAVGFLVMALVLLLNLLAGGGNTAKYILMAFLLGCFYASLLAAYAARLHRNEADTKKHLVMLDNVGVRWMYYDAHGAAVSLKPQEEFYIQHDLNWEQVRDVYVHRNKWLKNRGRVYFELDNGTEEGEVVELNLVYFTHLMQIDQFTEEVLYRFVKSR